jgi:hypothetical protein
MIEYMEGGSLHDYLEKHDNQVTEDDVKLILQ